uniref:Ig-like domain-containing protein n=1 Tax=Denticeps clupeoides TaxID=299321 RepID=A0AAY4CLB0_9TELE
MQGLPLLLFLSHKNGIVGEDVLLPCACTKEQNVTWQNKAENVVYDSRSNEEGRGYVNRTRLLLNNEGGRCSLLLRRVSVADEGTYVCYVLSTGERIVKKQETVLRVSAKYTVTVECRHGNSCTCNASGGYPEANVSWWQDGRRLENQSLMTSQRHEDSKLIDLFSTLTVHSNSKCVRHPLHLTITLGGHGVVGGRYFDLLCVCVCVCVCVRKLKLQGKFPRLLWFVCEPYLAQMASTESRSTSLLCP